MTQAIPLPRTPSGDFWAKTSGFKENSQVVSFGENLADFPKIHNFLNISKVNDFFLKLFRSQKVG
jgi:hypothetical protein